MRYCKFPAVSAFQARINATLPRIPGIKTCSTPFKTFVSRPSAKAVPAEVGVKNPPIPAPPARMASAKVPCGNNSYSTAPSCAAFTASGLDVKNEPIIFFNCPFLNNRPPPIPASPTLLPMNVRFLVEVSAKACIR